jgi:acetyl esterase/lipase
MKTLKNINYGDGDYPQQKLDLYLPDTKAFPVLVYLYGGGLEAGSKEDLQCFSDCTQDNIGVVIPDYRLYPAARYPEFIMDAAAAVAWTVKNIGTHGECKKMFIGGTSAGAYIAMMLCMDKRYLAPYGIDPDIIGGYIFDAGQPTVHFNILREAGIDPKKVVVDEKAPLYYVSAGRNYPPILTLCADNDMPNRLEQTMLLISTMKHFGYNDVEFQLMKGYEHSGYYQEPVLRKIITGFINKHLG